MGLGLADKAVELQNTDIRVDSIFIIVPQVMRVISQHEQSIIE